MGLDTAIERFRRREEDQWRSECTVTRESGERELDLSTGDLEAADSETIYTGKCAVRSSGWVGADRQAGEEEVRLRTLRGKLPVDTPVEKDDIFTVTACDFDADLVGREFRITDVLRDEWQIARVVMLEEVT